MSTKPLHGLPTSPCSGCGKPIVWGVDGVGHRIPLDPTPPVYDTELFMGRVSANRRKSAMVSHFATCPNANEFSRGKRK